MKRLNPATGLPFKKGDIRENGDVFYQYRKITKKWTNGYYVEYWLKPELFKKHNFTDRSGNERTVNRLATHLLGHAKGRCIGTPSRVASGRMPTNGVVTITLDWVIERITRGICEATGDKLTTKTKQPNTASLDRIDPSNPNYTPENSRIVTWQFNNMKGAFTDEEFIRIAKQLENVKKKSAASIPAGHSGKGEIYPELGPISCPGFGQVSNGVDHHRGAIYGKDTDHRTQESSGDSLAHRNRKVEPSQPPESEQDDWELHPTYGWIERRGGRLFD